MNNPKNSLIQTFTEQAEAVSARVVHVSGLDQALDEVVQSCVSKEACTPLATGCEQELSLAAADLCSLKDWSRIMAAPGLHSRDLEALTSLCRKESIKLIKDGLRSQLGGIDVGLTWAEHGIAQTGTVVMNSSQEDIRLAGMISEIHAVLLPASAIVPDTSSLAQRLEDDFENAPNYTAFITGSSRTSDIERVLTLGVHGPLQMHIFIIEDKNQGG